MGMRTDGCTSGYACVKQRDRRERKRKEERTRTFEWFTTLASHPREPYRVFTIVITRFGLSAFWWFTLYTIRPAMDVKRSCIDVGFVSKKRSAVFLSLPYVTPGGRQCSGRRWRNAPCVKVPRVVFRLAFNPPSKNTGSFPIIGSFDTFDARKIAAGTPCVFYRIAIDLQASTVDPKDD